MNTVEFSSQMMSYEKNLKYFALKLTRNNEDANDLVQETFLKALLNIDRYSDNTNLKAWLCTILKNTFINNYRKSSKRNDYNMDDKFHDYTLINKPSSYNPEKEFNFKELNSIIDSLEPEFRVPFQMYDSGYKYNEIAEELGLNLGTIKSRIHFSRKKIMKKINV